MPEERPVLSDRVRRRIEALLDEADAALAQGAWDVARTKARAVLGIDPTNGDALAFLAAAENALGGVDQPVTLTPHPTAEIGPAGGAPSVSPLPLGEGQGEGVAPQPGSFASGRYQVKRFLGEGGKKRVYL